MRTAHRILVIGIALVSTAIYLYTAAPFMLLEDAPRFLAAIVTLGIAWPAEPVYVFLAHWFTYLPFGSVVFRIQIFSALLAGGSLLILCRLVIQILSKPLSLGKKNKAPLIQPPLLLAGIFSMLVLAFSYQFWSQAQNVETFILDCFIELIILNLLLSEISNKTVFAISAVVIFICGVATGTDPPVIASIFPSVFLVIWNWKVGLGTKRLFILCLYGLIGIVLAWSYLPFAQSKQPLLDYVNGLTFKGIWDVATGQGSNVYLPKAGVQAGLIWSPIVMLSSAWHYLVMAWMDFTPFLLPLIVLGAVYLWRRQRYTFFLLFLVVITNFIFSCLYRSGNQESWYLQSDVIFAIFAGLGYVWFTEFLIARWSGLNHRIVQAGLLALAFIPLVYWWTTLDRHRWSFTQDYIDNLYSPLQEPAILVGAEDLWEATSSYVYSATNYKHNIVPVWDGGLYTRAWLRTNLASRSHIKIPDVSHLGSVEYNSKFMNDFFAENIGRYHIYLTQPAFDDVAANGGRNIKNFQIDQNRFSLIPVGMVQEVVSKNEKPDFNLSNFAYNFGNGFPQAKPKFLEGSYTGELQSVIDDMSRSYDNAANYLMDQGRGDEADTFYDKAFALNPEEPNILGDLGLFYGKQNQPAKAVKYFTKAYAAQPDNPTWLYNIALAEGQLGKIDEEKKDIKRIIDNPQVDATFKQALTKKLNSLNQQISSPEAIINPKTQSTPTGWKNFTNEAMNLTFAYPQTLRLNQMSPQLVSISASPNSDLESQLLIYSAKVSDLRKIPLPFQISGKLAQQQPVQFPGFQALMDVYSDTSGQISLLLLHKGQQVIAIRFPKQTAFDKELLNQIVQSINTVH